MIAPRSIRREQLDQAARAFSRAAILLLFLALAAGNITNSLLLDHGFNDQPVHRKVHASLSEMADGTAYRPYVYRSLPTQADRWVSARLLHADPGFIQWERSTHLGQHFFPDVPAPEWTAQLVTEYTLMYFGCVLMTMVGLFFVYRVGRFRGLSWAGAVALMMAFSFIYPLAFARSLLFYDFFEFAGVFAAVSLFLEERMIAASLVILAFSFVKETFFLVPIGLFFLHVPETTRKKRWLWLAAQALPALGTRAWLIHAFRHNPGGMIQFHLIGSLAFWLTPRLWLSFTPLAGPGIYLPRLENPILLVPFLLFFLAAWRKSEARWRGYFWAAFLPLLALYVPFCLGDTWRDFQLAFPAMTLIAISAVGEVDGIFNRPPWKTRGALPAYVPSSGGSNGPDQGASPAGLATHEPPSTQTGARSHAF